MAESKVQTAGYLFISLVFVPPCITVYIGEESGMLIHAGRNGPGEREGATEREEGGALKRL